MATKINIEVRNEARRGCGYRKQGGLYIVSGAEGVAVPCLPVPLHVCPVCNQGVKATRSFQWIIPGALFPQLGSSCNRYRYTAIGDGNGCITPVCPFMAAEDKAGLMWIGDKFYTMESFSREAAHMGISRRLSAVPKDFKIGEHWVFLGHRKAIAERAKGDGEKLNVDYTPGIFTAFKPTAIEYVVKPDDKPDKLERLVKRGITLVDVKPLQDSLPLD